MPSAVIYAHNVSRDASASRLRLVFLSILRSCSSHFLGALKKKQQQQTKIHYDGQNEYEGFWNYLLYLYSCVHLQYIQVCMCKRVIRACCYKEHLRDICRGMFCIRQHL